MRGMAPLNIHVASSPSVPTWPWARPHPRRPNGPPVLHPWLPSPPIPCLGFSGSRAFPPLYSSPTRPLNPLGLPISASLPPQPPYYAPSGSSAPRFTPYASGVHLSLSPARSVPQSHASGLFTPQTPRASPASPPLRTPRAAPGRPRPLPVPRRRELRAGAVRPRTGGVGPLLPPGGFAALLLQVLKSSAAPEGSRGCAATRPPSWVLERNRSLANCFTSRALGCWVDGGKQPLRHSAQTLSNTCAWQLLSGRAGKPTQTAPCPGDPQTARQGGTVPGAQHTFSGCVSFLLLL